MFLRTPGGRSRLPQCPGPLLSVDTAFAWTLCSCLRSRPTDGRGSRRVSPWAPVSVGTSEPSLALWQFPVTAVTSDHSSSGLKRRWAAALPKAQGTTCPYLFQLLKATRIPWLGVPGVPSSAFEGRADPLTSASISWPLPCSVPPPHPPFHVQGRPVLVPPPISLSLTTPAK